jgi:protein-tyrosine phosphatase
VDTDRLVPLERAHNLRDLGGYRAAGSGRVAWGRLFRADGLGDLSENDLATVESLGLRTVIDLRTRPELDQHGTFPTDRIEVRFHHLPVLDTTWSVQDRAAVGTPGEFLFHAYRDMLEQGHPRIARVLHVLAEEDAAPAVFHCAAGKDRTGVTAALLLAALGVDDDDIVDDFALTTEAMERMISWAREHRPEWVERMDSVPRHYMAADPEGMGMLLGWLRAEHRSPIAYLDTIGVDRETVDRLRARYLTY